jgi:SET domain-containing protein
VLIEVRRSRIQGRGVFALAPIAKGTRIIEYTGERISNEEADARCGDESKGRHHTFLFASTTRTVVDASREGSDARFINHSCDPNCETVVERGRIYVDAIKKIAAGAELSYDYWYSTDDTYTDEQLERLYPCRCGTSKCRGTLASRQHIEKPKQKKRAAAKKR